MNKKFLTEDLIAEWKKRADKHEGRASTQTNIMKVLIAFVLICCICGGIHLSLLPSTNNKLNTALADCPLNSENIIKVQPIPFNLGHVGYIVQVNDESYLFNVDGGIIVIDK